MLQARVEEQDAPSLQFGELMLTAKSGTEFRYKGGNRKSADAARTAAHGRTTLTSKTDPKDRSELPLWQLDVAAANEEQFRDSNTQKSDWTRCGILLPKKRALSRAQASRRSRQRNAHVDTAWAFSLERSSGGFCGDLEGRKPMPKSTSKPANKSNGKRPQY